MIDWKRGHGRCAGFLYCRVLCFSSRLHLTGHAERLTTRAQVQMHPEQWSLWFMLSPIWKLWQINRIPWAFERDSERSAANCISETSICVLSPSLSAHRKSEDLCNGVQATHLNWQFIRNTHMRLEVRHFLARDGPFLITGHSWLDIRVNSQPKYQNPNKTEELGELIPSPRTPAYHLSMDESTGTPEHYTNRDLNKYTDFNMELDFVVFL